MTPHLGIHGLMGRCVKSVPPPTLLAPESVPEPVPGCAAAGAAAGAEEDPSNINGDRQSR